MTYIQREAETDSKTRPRDDSTKRKREVEGGDGRASYILKYQSENGVLLPFLGSKEFPGSQGWLTGHELVVGVLDPKNIGACPV